MSNIPLKQQKYTARNLIFNLNFNILSPFWICLQCNFSGVCLLVSLLSALPPWLLLIYSWNKGRDVCLFVLFGESHKNKLDGSSERICKFKLQTFKNKQAILLNTLMDKSQRKLWMEIKPETIVRLISCCFLGVLSEHHCGGEDGSQLRGSHPGLPLASSCRGPHLTSPRL